MPENGSTVVSNVIYETAEALIIKHSPVTTNTAQTNSVREKNACCKKTVIKNILGPMPQSACQKFNLRLDGDTSNSRSSKYHPATATMQKPLAYLKESMPQKNSFKLSVAHCRRRWHKFLELSIPNWNTMYLIKIGMKPCPKIHGRKSYNIPDHRFRLKCKTCCASITILADEILRKFRIFSIRIQIRWRSLTLFAKNLWH